MIGPDDGAEAALHDAWGRIDSLLAERNHYFARLAETTEELCLARAEIERLKAARREALEEVLRRTEWPAVVLADGTLTDEEVATDAGREQVRDEVRRMIAGLEDAP